VSVDLVRDGLRDEGFSRPGRPVEEDTFRWVYPEAFEELGVAQGELDHLPDELELPGETADVLVVDIRDLAFLLLLLLGLVRRLLQLDLGVLGDNGYPFRADLGDDEGERVPDHVDPHRLAFHDGAAPEYPRQVLLSTHQPDRLGGVDDHLLGISHLHLPDLDALVDTGPRVAADRPVDPDDGLACVLGKPGPDDGSCLLLALDLDNVP